MPDDGKILGLYERDFYAWGFEQARAIRAAQAAFLDSGTNDLRTSLSGLDWENLAEEIEALSKKDRRELRERIGTVIEHLIKLQFSPAKEPRDGWEETVMRSREAIAMLLDESPSLRPAVAASIAEAIPSARRYAAKGLRSYGERVAAAAAGASAYEAEQVLTDWWPDSAV